MYKELPFLVPTQLQVAHFAIIVANSLDCLTKICSDQFTQIDR